MSVPSVNVIGGVIAAAALAALLYFGLQSATSFTPVLTPAPVHVKVAPAPVKPVVRAPLPPVKAKPVEVAPAPALAPVKKRPTYHRVLPGGHVDGAISCAQVKSVASQYTPAQIAWAVQHYNLTAKEIEALKVCLN